MGEPLRLRYQKAPYGPYAENLRHVLDHIEGHYIRGYGDAEDRPDTQIELDMEASARAEAFLRDRPATAERFDRVVESIEGFETPYGMELLSTVHWVATREGAVTPNEVVAAVCGWSGRNRMFAPEHVHFAWTSLAGKGWLGGP